MATSTRSRRSARSALSRKDAPTTLRRSLTTELGLQGWQDLDAVLLASLALEAPLLLVGAHGTAKSLVTERVAGALGTKLRHYNASLLNYDDLVGIPVPSDDGRSLEYLGTAGAVWDAEFLFLDEVNRCRPDLQNKLFPLVHERRLAGEELPRLRHRWAAINPPGEADGQTYLGVEELDAALADRFWFVVPVPGWSQLGREDRVRLVRDGAAPPAVTGPDDDAPGLPELVSAAAAAAETVEGLHGEALANYVVTLLDQLAQTDVHLSPRRARILLKAVCSVHGARLVSGDEAASLESSAELALLHALPQRAAVVPLQVAKVVAAHKQAWELAVVDEGGVLRQLLDEPDLVRRVQLGVELGVDDDLLGRLALRAVVGQRTSAGSDGLAFVLTRAFADRPLNPASWGPIVESARRILTPSASSPGVPQGLQLDRVRDIEAYCAGLDDSPSSDLQRAFLQGCRLSLTITDEWRDQLDQFLGHCAAFGVTG
ncbi:MAG: AAA family ATPase [Actinomycetes bacterium]